MNYPKLNGDELPNFEQEITEREFEKFKFGLSQRLPGQAVRAKPSVAFDRFLDEFVYHLEAYVWAENLETWEIKYPRDWWSAFKECWFPAWALKRWPVEYRHLKIDLKALYPGLNLALPKEDHRLRLLKYEGFIK